MSYDHKFNNTLAIWTAFGGRGIIEFKVPVLIVQKLFYNDFGYTKYLSEEQISMHNNGNAQIAVYDAKTPYMSYYNHTTKAWTVVSSPYWGYGAPYILYAGDGVFLAKITGMANIIASFDGITWHNSGYCVNAKNAMTCGAYASDQGSGVVSFWSVNSPLYYSFDPLENRTEWPMASTAPFFSCITRHKNYFVGIDGGDLMIAKASVTSPSSWTTAIAEDVIGTNYLDIKSINGVLFVMASVYENATWVTKLCVLDDTATIKTETNLGFVGSLTDNRKPNAKNIVWMESWQRFVLFTSGKLHLSADGILWESYDQPALDILDDVFAGAIYVPNDGFYIKGNGCVYYAPY